MDDRAGAQEQGGLEAGVCHQVTHRERVMPERMADHHVAQLTAGGIRDHPLRVALPQADSRGHDQRQAANHERAVAQGCVAAGHGQHVYPGRDEGGGEV